MTDSSDTLSSQGDESENSENDLNLSATETESDDSDNDNDDNESEDESNESGDNESTDETKELPKSKADIITENIFHKYEELQGKQLYIRFPCKLPSDETEFQQKVLAISPLIVKAHKPRQKHARFCLVDFKSNDDRNNTLKSIQNDSKLKTDLKGVVATIPRTESVEFLKEMADRKLKSMETKKAKSRLRRASKQALKTKNFTSSVVILNLPKSSSLVEVRKLFPNAVDIQIKPGKGKLNGSSVAAITLQSTLEARAIVKKKMSLGGTHLKIRFNAQKIKSKHNSKRKSLDKMDKTSPKIKKIKL